MPALSRRWHRERAGNDFGLGAAQFVQAERYIYVANVVGRRGIRTGSKGVPVRYEAIDAGLEKGPGPNPSSPTGW